MADRSLILPELLGAYTAAVEALDLARRKKHPGEKIVPPEEIALLERAVAAAQDFAAQDLAGRLELAARLLDESSRAAIIAQKHTLKNAIRIGELCEAATVLFPGNYEEWLEARGIAKMTAWRWRKCWEHRARLLDDHPQLKTLTDAYVRLGLMPPPEPDDKPRLTERPPYQFRLVIDHARPIGQWPRIELDDFVRQTARVAELRQQAIARLAEF